MKKKMWDLFGIGIGIAAVIAGLVFLFTPADSFSTSSTRSAAFGVDFYTEEYEATRNAANNAAVTANNLRELSEKLAQYVGTAFLISGLLITVHYGKRLVPEPVTPPSAPVSPTEEVQAPSHTGEDPVPSDTPTQP